MKSFSVAFYAEFVKFRKSRVFIFSIMFFCFVPVMTGLMMLIAQNPEIAEKMGIVGTKAQLFKTNDWEGFFGMLNQAAATIGLIGSGFVVSWIFGSEFSNRTIKDILSLPVARHQIVLAKLVVSFIWCIVLFLVILAFGLGIGFAIGVPGWTNDVFLQFVKIYSAASLLTLLLNPFVAYITGIGRGIIAPLAFVIFTMILAQFTAVLGWGAYLPWTIPGLLSVGSDAAGMSPVLASYFVLAFYAIIGTVLTVRQWYRSDYQ
jgi:ABC-2 type transport system permease protein